MINTEVRPSVITYRAATKPLRRAVAGEVGSHFVKGECAERDCYVTAWRTSRWAGIVVLCDHGRVQYATPVVKARWVQGLPFWAPLCR
jgi:hypothetical protein